MSSNRNHRGALPKRRATEPIEPQGIGTLASVPRTLSMLRYCSQREALALIAQGRVTVDGLSVRQPGQRVDPRRSRIMVDGDAVTADRKIHLMLNKPRGLAIARRAPGSRGTIHACLPEGLPFLSPVGRLEKASEGLIFMTNDTAWAERLIDPETGVTATYEVEIDRAADAALIAALARPGAQSGDALAALSARPLRSDGRSAWIEMIVARGSDRSIRRRLSREGATVLRLVRTAIGDVALGDLGRGRTRILSRTDMERLATPARSPFEMRAPDRLTAGS